MPYSVTYAGVIASVLVGVLEPVGVVIEEDALASSLNVLLQVVFGLVAVYGRWRHGGVSLLGVKNSKS